MVSIDNLKALQKSTGNTNTKTTTKTDTKDENTYKLTETLYM